MSSTPKLPPPSTTRLPTLTSPPPPSRVQSLLLPPTLPRLFAHLALLALLGLLPLLICFPDGDLWPFRVYGLCVGVCSGRAVLRWTKRKDYDAVEESWEEAERGEQGEGEEEGERDEDGKVVKD